MGRTRPDWHDWMLMRADLSSKREIIEDDIEKELIEILEKRTREDMSRHESYSRIPRFWPRKDQTLAKLLRNAALRRCESEAMVLTWEELERLRLALNSLVEDTVSYERLCEIRRKVCDEISCNSRHLVIATHLSARRFLQVPRDSSGKACARDIYNNIDRATCAAKTKAALERYDTKKKGYLCEQELERYISDLIPDMPAAHTMDVKFHVFYVFTAVRRFFFFLDPKKRGYIRIDHAATSSVALDLLDIFTTDDSPIDSPITSPDQKKNEKDKVTTSTKIPLSGVDRLTALAHHTRINILPYSDRNSDSSPPSSPSPPASPTSPTSPPSILTKLKPILTRRSSSQRSWFFPESAKRIYAEYLELDIDHNGMLSKSEFLHFRGPRGDTRLTATFVDRVFAEIITYPTENPPHSGQFHAEMEFKTYLDLVLAFDNIDQPQALSYFWRLLDLENNGKLDPFIIKFFFRDIAHRLHIEGYESPAIDDVVDEIFDMVKPKHSTYITFDDLIHSRQAHTIVLMLVDVAGFLAYDNREHLIQGGPDMDDDF